MRQYLKLNARLLGFNIDPDFGSVLDALVLVDLPNLEPRIINKYFGREAAAEYLAFHSEPNR